MFPALSTVWPGSQPAAATDPALHAPRAADQQHITGPDPACSDYRYKYTDIDAGQTMSLTAPHPDLLDPRNKNFNTHQKMESKWTGV